MKVIIILTRGSSRINTKVIMSNYKLIYRYTVTITVSHFKTRYHLGSLWLRQNNLNPNVDKYSIMILMKFVVLSQSDCSKLGHVRNQGFISTTRAWPGKNSSHNKCNNLEDITGYFITLSKSKWKEKIYKNTISWTWQLFFSHYILEGDLQQNGQCCQMGDYLKVLVKGVPDVRKSCSGLNTTIKCQNDSVSDGQQAACPV